MRRRAKWILLLVALLVVGLSSVCSATIKDSDIVIGGISHHCTLEYAKSIYGEPTKVKEFPIDGGGRGPNRAIGLNYYWGDTFHISTYNYNGHTHILFITTTANNGIMTKAGIRVGMHKKDMLGTYGEPSNIYKYNGVTYYSYGPQGPAELVFGLEDDTIISISGGEDY